MTTNEARESRSAEVKAAVTALLPELNERSDEIDRLRQLPQDIAKKLAEAGCYRLCAPTGAGGLDLGVRGMCEVSELLATANGSAAWCAFIASTSQMNAAGATVSFREAELLDPGIILAGVFSPSGTAMAEARDGVDGYLVNGHWRWGSGCHNAHWISGALTEVDHDGAPIKGSTMTRVFLHPDEVDIQDNWHVTGMRGTGSSDFLATDLWVPASRAIRSNRSGAFADEPVFRFPLFGVLSTPMGAIALGMARACVDEVATLALTKTPNGSRRTLATRPLVHFQFAEAKTKLQAARALFYQAIDEAWAKALVGDTDLEDRLAVRTANYHAVHTSAAVIDRMYSIVGGSSVYETSPLQRHKRDVHVATQHMMNADSVMELAGRVMFGVDERGAGL